MRRIVLTAVAACALIACEGDTQGDGETVDTDPSAEESSAGVSVAGFGDGVVTREVSGTLDDAIVRLETALDEMGFGVVAKLDHQANAATLDRQMPPAVVIFFGKPEVGTGLIVAAPTAALDLPQRMAIFQDKDVVKVAYNDPTYLATRHNITGKDEALAKMGEALSALAAAAAGDAPETKDDNE